jgi:N-acetylmuramoyl-L-alanine amidase
MKKFNIVTISFLSLILISLIFFGQKGFFSRVENYLASIFFTESTTTNELLNKYNNQQNNISNGIKSPKQIAEEAKKAGPSTKLGVNKVKMILVPGHDDESIGTRFGKTKEADLNLRLSQEINNLFEQNNKFETILLRDTNGYNQQFLSYFQTNKDDIAEFRTEQKLLMNTFMDADLIENQKDGVEHNSAPSKTVNILYGVNKWANENKVDIVLHIHFNDYPRKYSKQIGRYSGFAIYVPESQFSNAKASYDLAKSITARLDDFFAISNMPKEKDGVVEDQKLIAIGANNSLDSAGLLIEYGYIYEKQFINQNTQELAVKELAQQTYLGILDFFNQSKPNKKETAILPYQWKNNLKNGLRYNKDVFALQTALVLEEMYPPENFDKHNCPISGNFGNCTLAAVIDFQKKYNIEPTIGFVGPKTREKLNEVYGIESKGNP